MIFKLKEAISYNGQKAIVVGHFYVKGEIQSYMIKVDGKIIMNIFPAQLRSGTEI